ncbi:MAG: CPBP family intramembrane metalloprotease [Planctomycetes bacterium]|nr:CPBP family intramembrane metalloprotease [Planctomycetota bacterium]
MPASQSGFVAWLCRESIYVVVTLAVVLMVTLPGEKVSNAGPEQHGQAEIAEDRQEDGKPKASANNPFNLSAEEIEKLWVTHPLGALALAALGVAMMTAFLAGCGILAWWAIGVFRRAGTDVFSDWPPCRWGLWDVVKTFSLYLFLCQAAAMAWPPGATGPGPGLSELGQTLLLHVPATILICLFMGHLLTVQKRHSFEEAGWIPRSPSVAAGVLGYLAILPLVAGAAAVNTWIFEYLGEPILPHPVATELQTTRSISEAAALLVFACALAPIWEELFFRGLLYPVLRRRLGVTGAIALSATAFAAMHANLSQILPLFILGVLLAYLFERTRSVWSSITAHAVFNTGSMAALLILRFAVG